MTNPNLRAENIVAARPHTRSTGRQNHENVLPNISSRIVAQVVDQLAPFITDRTDKNWPCALERAERKTLKILQEKESNHA